MVDGIAGVCSSLHSTTGDGVCGVAAELAGALLTNYYLDVLLNINGADNIQHMTGNASQTFYGSDKIRLNPQQVLQIFRSKY